MDCVGRLQVGQEDLMGLSWSITVRWDGTLGRDAIMLVDYSSEWKLLWDYVGRSERKLWFDYVERL